MPDRSKMRRHIGLSILIALAVSAFFANYWFHETENDPVDHDQEPLAMEAERVDDFPAKPSPGELAHNENYFGLGRLENRDYQGAIDKFISATELDPDNPEYHANLGIAYEKEGQHDNAIDQLEEALKSQPDNPDYLSWLGNAYFSKEQWQEAAEAYDRAIKFGADDHRVFFSAAQVYLEIGTRIKALGAIDSAIERHGDDPDYYTISGIIKYSFKRYEDAIEDFEVARKMNPGNPVDNEWLQHATEALRDGNMPKKDPRTDGHADEYDQGSANNHRGKLDEIYRRMEKLKKEFLDKSK